MNSNSHEQHGTDDDRDPDDEFGVDESDSDLGIDEPVDRAALRQIAESTPSRLGVGRAGPRPRTETLLRFRADHGRARDAVLSTVDESIVSDLDLVPIQTRVSDKDEYLARPDLGAELSEAAIETLREECEPEPTVQIVVSDGLSSTAVEANVPDLLPVLREGLRERGLEVGTPVFVTFGRVDVMDAIGEELGADCCVNLIGERPGLATAASLSAYMVYGPERGAPTAKKSVISNIHDGGLPPVEAGARIAELLAEMVDAEASGIDLREDDREFQKQ